MKRTLCLPPLVALVFGCSGEGNTGHPLPNIDLWSQLPWADHGTPQFNTKADGSSGSVKISGAPYYPPIGENTPDPGSRPIDCSVTDNIVIAPYLDSFEPDATFAAANPGRAWGVATAWSNYDDGSDGAFRTPGDVGWYPDLGGTIIGGGNTDFIYDRAHSPWGLAADQISKIPGARPNCDVDQSDGVGGVSRLSGATNDWILHARGGRFNYYGGGMTHVLSPVPDPAFKYCPTTADGRDTDLCPSPERRDGGSKPVFTPPPGGFLRPRPGFWDASSYDGVTFWARRGPDGAPQMLVALVDKYINDDLARETQQYCKRIKVCVPNCVNGFGCNKDGMGRTRCLPEGYVIDPTMNPALAEFLFPPCGASTCVSGSFYPDPDFDGTQCNVTAFTGNEEGYWCSSKDKPVAPYAERCGGDSYSAAVTLSTDWQLYKLPFDSFRQVGFGRPSPKFDLTTLSVIGFLFTVGYTDVYVDNVSFYRNK